MLIGGSVAVPYCPPPPRQTHRCGHDASRAGREVGLRSHSCIHGRMDVPPGELARRRQLMNHCPPVWSRSLGLQLPYLPNAASDEAGGHVVSAKLQVGSEETDGVGRLLSR